jgi:signal transduction histidine kinase
VHGDYSRLRQMIFIILDNAIKFSPVGGSVTVALKDRTLSVIDHGTGISEEDMLYIFDRFYKVRSEENKNGTGLGLAIAKQIALRHNIKISVSSEINKGSVFSFEF